VRLPRFHGSRERKVPIPSSEGLAESFAEAEARANLLAAAPTPWNANRERRFRSSRWTALAGLAASALVAVGYMLAGGSREAPGPNPQVLAASAEQATRPVLETSDASSRRDAVRPAADAAVAIGDARSNSARSNSVTRKGAFVEMSFEGIPLTEAIASLGAATGGRVHGSANLASVTSLVTLRWQGSGLEAAWSALLSPVANSAVACGPQACDVWIVGVREHAGSSRGPDQVSEQAGSRGPAAVDRGRALPVIAAVPMDTPPVPRARRNDGALEAPSSD
jgi:hypothetical protein